MTAPASCFQREGLLDMDVCGYRDSIANLTLYAKDVIYCCFLKLLLYSLGLKATSRSTGQGKSFNRTPGGNF